MRALLAACLLFLATPSFAADERETIAIIGAGSYGGTLGKRLGALGYPIVYGSRDPSRKEVRELLAKTPHGRAMKPAEAAASARIVLFAVPWEAAEQSARSLGDLKGKIVIDVTNPLLFEDGRVVEASVPHSGAELLQSWLPGAIVVKALNTVNWSIVEDPARAGGPVTIAIAADDSAAKDRVAALASALGFEALDAGKLANARYLEGMALLYVDLLTQKPPRRFEYHLRRL